jgi:hypothetical protein
MPVRRSGRHVHARQVVGLMTSAALNRIRSVPIGPTRDLHGMRMAIVSLAREVSRGVTIHTARMTQHRNDSFKSGGAIGLRSGIECQQECSYDV